MGTPHHGTRSFDSQSSLYTAIASNPSVHVENSVLKALEYGNDILMDVLNEFVALCISPEHKLSLFCFFEQRSTVIGKIIGDESLKVLFLCSLPS